MFPFNYVYLGVGAALLASSGIIWYQSNTIDSLKNDNTILTSKKTDLETSIKNQNAALRAGENKFTEVQRNLDIASGKNAALTTEYALLRNSWKSQPVPKDCPAAIDELQVRSSDLSKRWNNK